MAARQPLLDVFLRLIDGQTELLVNASGGPLVVGDVVRINGDGTVTKAQANIPGNAQGTIGVVKGGGAAGATVEIVTGQARVRLEAALVPVAGGDLFLSAATAGLGTTVPPANVVILGVIKDASGYATDGTVLADVRIDTVFGGPFPGFGPAPAQIDVGDAGNAGASGLASRSDHQHAFPGPLAAPPDVAGVGAIGAATTPAHSDHTHGHGAQALGAGTDHAVATPNPGGVAGFMSAADKTKLDALPSGGQVLTWGADSIAATADTRYLTPGFSPTTAGTAVLEFAAARAGTLRNLFARWNAAPGGANGNAVDVKVRINGVDTALVVSRAANAGVGQSSNLVNTVAVAQGDRIAVVVTKALAIGSGVLQPLVSVEFA